MSPLNSPNVSAPPPPPPPPPVDWGKDWRQTKDNNQNGKPSGSITSEISNSTKPKRVLSQGPTQQPPSNFAESPLFREMQEKYNADSKAADDRSFVDNREQHGSRSEQKKFLTPQKPIISERSVQFSNSNPQNCTSISINTSVGISKADALKYSIATLLLCTSSIAAGIYTYLAISAILSSVAVPVLFAVIAFVSASIVVGSTVYLINSFFSAVSSEKKMDLDKLQCGKSQDIVGNAADLPIPAQPPVTLGAQPSPSASVSPPPPPPQLSHSAAPPPPPLLPPTLPKGVPPLPSGSSNSPIQPCNAGLSAEIRNRSTELKKPNIPDIPKGDARDVLINSIKGADVKTVMSKEQRRKRDEKIEQSRKKLETIKKKDDLYVLLQEKLRNIRGAATKNQEGDSQQPISLKLEESLKEMVPLSQSFSSNEGCGQEQDWSDDENGYVIPQTSQPNKKGGANTPESGNVSDGDAKSKPTSPLLPPKPANLQTKSKVPPVKKEGNINLVDSEVQDPSTLPVKERARMFEN